MDLDGNWVEIPAHCWRPALYRALRSTGFTRRESVQIMWEGGFAYVEEAS